MTARKLVLLAALLLLACHGKAETEGSAFDRAARAAANGEFKNAAELFAEAARSEPDGEQRQEAVVRLANLEWRGLGKSAQARQRLQQLGTVDAQVELARMAIEQGDFAAARAAAKKAAGMAKKKRDRTRATTTLAMAVVRDPAAAKDELRATVASLRELIAANGPRLEPSRILARAGLRAGDGPAALEGIDGYYHVSAFAGAPQAIAAAHAVLARLLPAWQGSDAERPALAQALAGIRFFDEAALVQPVGEPAAYAAVLRRIETATNEYYRAIANGHEDDDVLRDAVKSALGKRAAEYVKRFGLYYVIGKTGTHVDLHMGHVVADQTLPVEQYGHRAATRFVALDGMVSNGFSEWANDHASGDGGWGTAKAIYQVRPRYADDPLRQWERTTDDEARAEESRKIAEETARDVARAKQNPIQYFPGLARRLQRQYLDAVYAELPRREAFLARVEADQFTSSIHRHEGRHAIDLASGKHYDTWELEYRAKLSEIALAPAPREALGSVLDNDIGGENTHGKANGKLAAELVAWMGRHQAEIPGFNPALPAMPQIDRLTDDQIRTAVGELDPLKK